MNKIKNEIAKIVASLNDQNMPNEWKKRVAVAKINEFMIANGLEVSIKEIDELIEIEVSENGSK